MKPILAILLFAACATDERTSSSASNLIGGAIDDKHPYAVGICMVEPGETCRTSGCTGSLIAPNLVLTAQHCVAPFRPGEQFCESTFGDTFDPEKMFVSTHGDPQSTDAKWYGVSKILVPSVPTACAADVALMILGETIPEAEARPVAVDVTNALDPDKVAVVGRGWVDAEITETEGLVPLDDGDHRRRVLEGVDVICRPDSKGGCVLEDSSDPSGSFIAHDAHLVIGKSGLPGDSGSGVIDQASFAADAPVLVAVLHAGVWENGRPGPTLAVDTSKHTTFLSDGAKQAAAAGKYSVPAWVEGDLPDDASGGGCNAGAGVGAPMVMIVLAWLLRRRRAALGALVLAACSGGSEPTSTPDAAKPTTSADAKPRPDAEMPEQQATAVVTFAQKSGSTIIQAPYDQVVLLEESDKVLLGYVISPVPTGHFALRIHETGDCSAADAASAGNPLAEPTIAGKPDGFELVFRGETTGAYAGLVQKSLVLHELANATDTTGKRIGCGVIPAAP